MLFQKKMILCLVYCAIATSSRGARGMSISSLAFGNSIGMERFSEADCALCVREFYKNGHSATVARRRFSNNRGFRHLNDASSILIFENESKCSKRAVQH